MQKAQKQMLRNTHCIQEKESQKIEKKLMPKIPGSKSLPVLLVKNNLNNNCRGFAYYAAKLWNSLPVEIRTVNESR